MFVLCVIDRRNLSDRNAIIIFFFFLQNVLKTVKECLDNANTSVLTNLICFIVIISFALLLNLLVKCLFSTFFGFRLLFPIIHQFFFIAINNKKQHFYSRTIKIEEWNVRYAINRNLEFITGPFVVVRVPLSFVELSN